MRQRNRVSTLNIATCQTIEEVLDIENEGVSAPAFINTTTFTNEDGPSNQRTVQRRKTVSCREYYVYKLQVHRNDRSYILRFGRLLQQYVVENYIKLETMRLAYHATHQKTLRHEHYKGIMDSVISCIHIGGEVGKGTYLPASFIGGPRDMHNRYLDSMALVQEYGRPDIFLTMTC